MNSLVIIVGVIVLFLLTAALLSKESLIEKTLIINRPKEEVFNYIRFVKNHQNFNVWMQMDPDMKKEYRGTDGTEGFVYYWESNKKKNVGTGEQEIKKITEGESIEFELRFLQPMQSVAQATITTETVAHNQTLVSWSFYSQSKFPMNVMSKLMEKSLGNYLRQNLNNLKSILEKTA